MNSTASAVDDVQSCIKDDDVFRNLTFVHEYIVTLNQQTLTEGLSNRMCAIFMNSLKLFQSVDQSQTSTICCCVQCKENILLMLTNVHILCQCPDGGHELKRLIISEVRSTIYKKEELHRVLVTLMDTIDEHIRYMASKCFKAVLLWIDEKEHGTPTETATKLAFDLTEGLDMTSMLGLNTRISILIEIFSGKYSPGTATVDGIRIELLNNLTQKWEKTVSYILKMTADSDIEETAVYSTLCLWVKLLKYCSETETKIQENKIDTKIFYSTTKLLLECDSNVFSKWYIDVKRYKVLNQVIGASMKPSAADQYDEEYIGMLKEILEKVPCSLGSIPTTGVQHCFGGHSVVERPCNLYSYDILDFEKADKQTVQRDVECVRGAVLLTLKVCYALSEMDKTGSCRKLIISSISEIKDFIQNENIDVGEHSSATLMNLYSDQDDKLLEALNVMIDVFLSFEHYEGIPIALQEFSPHFIFIAFLESIGFDYSLMLDFLTSPETCFLQYFVKYLKYAARNWDSFQLCCQQQSPKIETVLDSENREFPEEKHDLTPAQNNGQYNTTQTESNIDSEIEINLPLLLKGTKLCDYSDSSSESDSQQDSSPLDGDTNLEHCDASCLDKTVTQQNSEMLDDVMTSLIRLRISLDKLDRKNLFPYNIKPVIHLLVRCEELYES